MNLQFTWPEMQAITAAALRHGLTAEEFVSGAAIKAAGGSKVRAKDVAKACGVSEMVVSHVFKGNVGKMGGVSGEMQKLVLATAKKLRYLPSAPESRGTTRKKRSTKT